MNRLEPLRWRLDASPQALVSAVRAVHPQAPPLVLRIDRRGNPAALLRERLAATLTPQEWRRHDAFRLQPARERFLLGRGVLRLLLGCWLDREPDAVTIALGSHGKPFCPGGPEFNLSHSGDLVLLALHPCRPVGVDVEQRRPDLNWEPIARRMFGADLVEELLRRPELEQRPAFLQNWCRLEAELKAAGWGIAAAPPPERRSVACLHWTLALPEGYLGHAALLASPPG
ncbi:MAG: 4'-phosphopantetheinyl transferase superfamily protein [Synechococcaceae cyanobacterium]